MTGARQDLTTRRISMHCVFMMLYGFMSHEI